LSAEEVQGAHLLDLDIGLPVDQLRKPVRDTIAGDGGGLLVVDAVNRRGRPVRVELRFSPLARDGAPARGAVVLMEVVDGGPESPA
jgi:two-component system CheB/CheR fusion protein